MRLPALTFFTVASKRSSTLASTASRPKVARIVSHCDSYLS